jgi:nitric oxide reductase subunit B
MSDYSAQFSVRRLWLIFAVTMALMFGTLIYFGQQIYQTKPPIPATVATTAGQVLFTRAEIEHGQNVWQSMGGMEQGSIWGHGSYVAPDWSADWLHREALALLDVMARGEGRGAYAALAAPEQARLQAMLRQEMRTNTYDPATGAIAVSPARAEAIGLVAVHFSELLQGATPEGQALRVQYAMPVHATLSAQEAHAVDAFYFWTAWSATTNRPGKAYTYTSNWPHEPLVGNTPTGDVFMWTFVSIFVLLGAIGAIVWYYAREFDIWRRDGIPEAGFATRDFMVGAVITPSMRATLKYFILVVALFGPAWPTASTPTSRLWSTGAGGWSTFGSKACSRCSPPRSSRPCSSAWGWCGSRSPPPRCCSPPWSSWAAACSARSTTSTSAARPPP